MRPKGGSKSVVRHGGAPHGVISLPRPSSHFWRFGQWRSGGARSRRLQHHRQRKRCRGRDVAWRLKPRWRTATACHLCLVVLARKTHIRILSALRGTRAQNGGVCFPVADALPHRSPPVLIGARVRFPRRPSNSLRRAVARRRPRPSQTEARIQLDSSDFALAPIIFATLCPSLKITNIGIERTPHLRVTAGFTSTLSLATFCLAARSRPYRSARKSTCARHVRRSWLS